MQPPIRPLTLAFLTLLVGCSADPAQDAPLPGVSLFPGTQLVSEGNPALDSDCAIVGDVVPTGDRLVLAVTRNYAWDEPFHTLLESGDRGRSWTRHELPPRSDPQRQAGWLPMQVVGGKLHVLLRGSREGALGLDYPFWQLGAIQADWTWDALPAGGEFHGSPVVAGSRVVAAYSWADPRGGPTSLYIEDYSLETATMTATQYASEEAAPVVWLGSSYALVGFALDRDQLCKVSLSIFEEDKGWLTRECVPRAELPGETGTQLGYLVATPLGYRVAIGSGQRTWAADVGAQGLQLVDLGPGALDIASGYELRPRYGGLWKVGNSDADTRFVRLREDGTVEQVPIPPSPCVEGSACGSFHGVVRVEPLGGDDYLVAYSIDFGGALACHNAVLTRVVHAPALPASGE